MSGSSRLRLATPIVVASSRLRPMLSVARLSESRRLSSAARSVGLCALTLATSATRDSGRSEGRTPTMVVTFIIPQPPWAFRAVSLSNRLATRNFCALGAPLSVTACAYCGRDNEAGAQFCIDCGKPLGKSSGIKAAAAVSGTRDAAAPLPAAALGEEARCPFCGARATAGLPFCARCASRVAPGARFCPTCGAPLSEPPHALARTSPVPRRSGGTIALVLLDEAGNVTERFDGHRPDVTIGRQVGDIRFPDDPFLSPLHARISWERDRLLVRDLGSRNGTWVFLEAPHRLADGDLLLIGSQVIRFRRLGYPRPHPPDADATRRMGSLIPSADIASLTQLRSDGSARDVIQLSPGRDVAIGREQGDWLFPYDPSMSARHATIRSEDADFVVVDSNSRNGVALAARGDITLRHNSRVLVGDKLLRIEMPA